MDKLNGRVRFDNSKDPASAVSMMKRKSQSAGPPPGKDTFLGAGGKKVLYRNDRQKFGKY